MPTITINPEDFYELIGKKLTDKELNQTLDAAKAELDSKLTTELIIKFNDTNQPYLWSTEGLARFFRYYLGKQKGIPQVKLTKPTETIIHDRKLKKIRPYIACFKATGKKIDEQLILQLIQLQEKLAENFGRKRQKISIGVYPLKEITFPVTCKAVSPLEKFIPLDFHDEMTLAETIEKHPKGKEYGNLIKGHEHYPVFIDSKKEILSLIPVINSEKTGKVKSGDDAIFFDTTGTDEESVNLVANIFALALAERGFTIEPIKIEYPNKKVITPTFECKKHKLKEENIEKLLGIKLNSSEIKHTLTKMGYEYQNGTVTIPYYRNDIMHEVDIIEDIAIAHGYDNFEAQKLTCATTGETLKIQEKIDQHRIQWIGLGYQEILNPILSNKQLLYQQTNTPDFGTIEIENPVSLTYSFLRTWIIPQQLELLSKNSNVEYPQKIVEQ